MGAGCEHQSAESLEGRVVGENGNSWDGCRGACAKALPTYVDYQQFKKRRHETPEKNPESEGQAN